MLTCLEICAGAGGQAVGLEQAGFGHEAVIERDPDACETLRLIRGSEWKVIEADVRCVDGRQFAGADPLSGGVPCPPFSIAGRQLGRDDERDLFPEALRLAEQVRPRAVLLENVRDLAGRRFADYRAQVLGRLGQLGFRTWWQLTQGQRARRPADAPPVRAGRAARSVGARIQLARALTAAAAHGRRDTA